MWGANSNLYCYYLIVTWENTSNITLQPYHFITMEALLSVGVKTSLVWVMFCQLEWKMLSYLCVIPLRSHLHHVPPMLVADGVWYLGYFPPLGSVWTGSSRPHILTGRTRLPTPRSCGCLSTLDITPTVLITLVSHPTDLLALRDCVAFFCEVTAGLREISLFLHFLHEVLLWTALQLPEPHWPPNNEGPIADEGYKKCPTCCSVCFYSRNEKSAFIMLTWELQIHLKCQNVSRCGEL